MTHSGNRFLLLFFFAVVAYPASGQEESLKRNNLSVAPLAFIDRTIPLSYSRYVDDQWNFTIYARYRIRKKDDPLLEPGMFESQYPHQPYLYSRAYVRSGMQYHHQWFMVEPLLQFDYGWMNDQWLIIEETDGGFSELQDRNYYSGGVILLAGTYHNFNMIRIRTYLGAGAHVKQFQIHAKDAWNNDPNLYPYRDDYFKFMPSLHLGIELGINF